MMPYQNVEKCDVMRIPLT